MKTTVLIAAALALAFIYIRKYLLTEKGIHLASLIFKPRIFFHHHEPQTHEVTLEEMIPASDTVDQKKLAKGDSLVKKADIFMNRGDARQAEKMLIQALSFDPSSVEAYRRLGLLYLKQGLFGKAEGIYRKLTVTITDEPSFFSNLGMALFSQQKYGDAKKYYKKAIELDSERAGRFFSLAQVLHQLNEVEEALNNFKRAIDMEPKNLDYLLTLSEFYIAREMYPEAKQLTNEILLAFPDNEEASKLAAVVAKNMG